MITFQRNKGVNHKHQSKSSVDVIYLYIKHMVVDQNPFILECPFFADLFMLAACITKKGTDILQHDPSRRLRGSTATQGHLQHQHLCDICATSSILSPDGALE